MDETLKKQIFFDEDDFSGNKQIVCTLIAHSTWSYAVREGNTLKQRAKKPDSVNEFNDKNNLGRDFLSWSLHLYLPGPDNRHRPGIATLDPNNVWDVYRALVSAQKKMKKLAKAEFDGEYLKKIDCSMRSPHFEIEVEGGNTLLVFWLVSDGKYKYARKFDTSQTSKIIESLYNVFTLGPQLVADLKSIA